LTNSVTQFVRVLGSLLVVFGAQFAVAAIPSLQAKVQKQDKYIENGLIKGGEAAKAFSLVDFRWAYGKEKGIERMIFEFGDGRGEPLKGRPGYFQVNVDSLSRMVTVDFSQVSGSRLDQAELAKRLKASPYIQNVKMNYDPVDSTLTLTFKVSKAVRVEAFELPNQPKGGRLALDFRGK